MLIKTQITSTAEQQQAVNTQVITCVRRTDKPVPMPRAIKQNKIFTSYVVVIDGFNWISIIYIYDI